MLKKHVSDFDLVIERAKKNNVLDLIMIGGNWEHAEKSYKIAHMSDRFWCTIGLHPLNADVIY